MDSTYHINSNIWRTFHELDKYESALKCYKKIIEIDIEDISGWISLGVEYNKLGKHQKAIECFEKALALNPKHRSMWNDLGRAYEGLGNPEKALEYFMKVIDTPSENVDLLGYDKKIAWKIWGMSIIN